MTTDAVQEKIKDLEERLAKIEGNRTNLTMVLFSGDFDKAMAAFIIANGALAMGKEVTIFVTFWGLDVLKKPTMTGSGKNFLEQMVTAMRPKGPAMLPTSKMNFAGIGPKLFHYMMGKKNIASLQTLVDTSIEFGVKIVACQMSMDVMGIKREDLIDGIDFGGLGVIKKSSFNSTTLLFI